jgi:uncharacterized protein (TIGR03437 family)
MTRLPFLLSVALATALCLPAAAAIKPPAQRQPAPDFTLLDANEKPVHLAEMRGRVVLLNFWTTWCTPSMVDLPWFEEFYRNYAARGFSVIAASADDDGWGAVTPFLAHATYTFPIVVDDRGVYDIYGVDALPTTFLIDGEGRIAASYVGLGDKSAYQLDIEALLSELTTAPAITRVVNGADFQPVAASGTWISIFGANLAHGSRPWSGADFLNGALPTALDGVQVLVNNKPALVAFISPTQINALAPDDTALGPVAVQVLTPWGASNPLGVTRANYAPALFALPAGDGKYPVVQAADGALIGPVKLVNGLTTRPARVGETVVLYGTGFGAVSPAQPANRVVSGAVPLATPVSVRIGGVPAPVAWAGMIGPGLYQLNVVVPAVAVGEPALEIEVGSVAATGRVALAVSR